MKKILVLNSGSSSLKYQLFNVDGDKYEVVAKGLAERIGIDASKVSIKRADGTKKEVMVDLPTHNEALREVFNLLLDGVIKDLSEISAVGHRIVHGGEIFTGSVLVDEKVIQDIDELSTLAPLHNPAAVLGLRAVQNALPHVPQVTVFDTAFHQTMPKEAFLYGIPLNQYTDYKIRRYGAHGTSHRYVSEEIAKILGKNNRLIVCHLGNGASLSAIKDGVCMDTSMGFTPLGGIIMGTRSGDMDPYIPLHIMKTQGLSVDEMNVFLNKKSGMFGLTGFADMRDVENLYLQGDAKAVDAMKTYVYTIVKFIGSYIAALGGVDAIAFTAGIGENSPIIRKMVLERLSYLGISVDEEANNRRGDIEEISTKGSKVRAFVIPTNEELMIAKDTVALTK
ncbi:MAG: acetate kinase [bacterium]|nr:acetate kinase [bacterium]MDY2830945.1 acetate kinase [Alphaproteobacteria bacterium]